MTTSCVRSWMTAGLMMAALGAGGCGNTSSNGTVDCVAEPAKCACADDSKCADPNPRCDTRTGRCVPCLPTADNCSVSEHCVYQNGKGFTCVGKDVCASADDCPPVNGKAQLCCDGKCADRLNDTNNCGACSKVCDTVANANSGCVNGSCAVTMCKAGFGDCDGKPANGCESDVTGDVTHCGACATPCAKAPNTTMKCEASKCVYQCLTDFADCDGNPQNGCETSTSTNPKNCGACGKTCPSLPNAATVACSAGNCIVESCQPNFADCNKNGGDGCEANVTSDSNNCAGCGKKCPAVQNGSPGCQASSCGVGKCNNGFGDCDGNVLNGCEQDLTADAKNCGSCGMVCVAYQAVLSCQAGMCQLQACNQGFSDCDNNALNGCEAIVSRDLKNCGACGVVCPVPANATAQCSSGVCGVGSCMYGWGDCNKNINDGCETDLSQVANCGACGMQCPVPANGVAACKQLLCTVGMCNAGFLDCDNKFVNGCEINALNDNNNCGGCGSVCVPVKNQGTTCVGGKCGIGGCLQGYSDCNNNLNDGCEAQIANDNNNCGACGKVCPQGQTCSNSVCAAIRPNILVCGGTSRNPTTFTPQGMMFNVILNNCNPDGNTQALFITRGWGNGINAQNLQNYVNGGGVVLTEYNITYLVWNAAFGTNVGQGSNKGGCLDTLPSMAQFTPNDPFWMANGYMQNANGQTGCGYTVNHLTGITLLAGWDVNSAAVGYRDLGSGRVWATDFDWSDGENYPYAYTNQLMGYMMTHRR